MRRRDPEVAGRSFRGSRRASRRSPADRGNRRGRALRPALRRGRPLPPLLHTQSRRAQLRDLSPAWSKSQMSIAAQFRAEAAKRILIKDGPYGTAIQAEKLAA